MKQHTPARPLRLERFAWMVALVVVLRIAAWDLHFVFDLHQPAEHCEICLVMERGGDGMTAAAGQAVPPPASPAAQAAFANPCRTTTLPCPLPRGPPSFHS
jgi:hypothetical protein